MKRRVLEGQVALLLDESFFLPRPGLVKSSPAQPIDTIKVVQVLSKPEKKQKIVVPLGLQSIPMVTLHKGGGKIIIKPNDVVAALRLEEVREAIAEGDRIRKREEATQNTNNQESAKLSLLQKIEIIPGIGYKDLSLADRAYTLMGGGWEQHTISRVLKSFGLEVQLSPTLANWLKKEERRIKRELTPILLPEVLDSRPLFEKVEAGMVLECRKDFAFDKETIFQKGERYQVVDTARTAGQDGVVKIFKTPISPGIKLIVSGDNTFDWTAFHGEMEQTFHYEEKVIYDESKCVPAQYPELVQHYRKRLEESGLDASLFSHIIQDVPQMATKRDALDGKLMRMGKAQPLDAKLLTPSGWKLMGDIQVGDLVFGSDGKPYPVSGVFPQGEKKVFRIRFTDGSSTECCLEHLWQTLTPERKMSKRGSRVLALGEMVDRLVDGAGNIRFFIPIAQPFEFPEQDLPLDPYLVGCLLGDGRLGVGKKGYGTPSLTSADPELIAAVEARLPAGMKASSRGRYGYELTTPGADGSQRNPLIVVLEALDMRHRSESKFIPDIYKFASVLQRRQLLAGILDTDGGASDQNGDKAATIIEYTSVSKRLCDDVQFVVESLGGKATKSSRIPSYTYKGKKKKGQRAYRLRISFGPGYNPFLLKRKVDKYRSCTKFLPTRGIVAVEPVGAKVCQCITVDSPDSLYATDHCILTHNTREGATLVWLWGSRKCAWIGPRNARIFTQRELDTLGKTVPAFKNYVVVNELSDLQKPGDIYLMTYSWLKKMNDPQRQNRKQGKSLLRFTRREKGLDVINEHPCPHCGVPLVRPYIHKVYSDDILGRGKTVLWRAEEVEWKKDGGYVCTNPQCVRKYDNRKCKGTAWYAAKLIRTQGFDIQAVDKQGQPVTKHLNYWTDLNLKVHARCNQQSVRGRICTECGLVDGTWVPPLYKRCKDSFSTVVLDEIHTIKSADSDVGRAVRSFRGRHHVGMTGTLIPNTPSDTYWPLHWNFHAGSASFPYQGKGGATQYYDSFCEYVTIKRGNNLSDSRKMLPYLKNPIKFWEMMAPKMVRRNYEDPLVLESLTKAGLHMPKTRIHKISCDLDPLQASLMVASINNFEIQYNEMSAEAAQSHHLLNPALVLSQMSRMRIAATCPEHFNKVLAKQGQPPIYHGPLCGGKLKDIKNLVLQKTMGGKKVFILSGFISTRDSLGKELAEFEPIVFNNKWDDDERREAFDLFRNDPERRVFIAGTLEIREGIDMSAADAVICTDLLWQPGLQCQAWSRILTPTSQERDCDIYLLSAKSTVDEHIYNTFYAKVAAAEQALDRKVINVRAESMDIRWFVSRVLDDRARIIEAVREAGEELVLTPAIQAVEVEERVL